MKRFCTLVTGAAVAFAAANVAPAASVSLEVAATSTNANAHHQWLQLLSGVGVSNVRIRSARRGDEPAIEPLGDSGRHLRVVGVLDNRNRLVLPGGTFTDRDRTKLRDYFARLSADGAEGVLADTGAYGLTERQFKSLFDELSKPLGRSTKGKAPADIIAAAREVLRTPIDPSRTATSRLRAGSPLDAELRELTVGAALAITLAREGLALVPNKPRGGDVVLRVEPIAEGQEAWPVGYPVKGPPRNTAPDIMQTIAVEIDGFSLAEATAAIVPRLKTPVVWDTAALARRGIDPAKIQVKLPRVRLSYKRILEKLLFQARLSGQLRTDEAGKPFYWITK
ncbi:MAG: hypothetical protein AAGJ46_17670 [Planctomycetota bacterium]